MPAWKPTCENGCDKLCGIKPSLIGLTTFCWFMLMVSIATKLREDLDQPFITSWHTHTTWFLDWQIFSFLPLACIHGNTLFGSSAGVQTLGPLVISPTNLSQLAIRLQPYPRCQGFSVQNVWLVWTYFWISFFFHGVSFQTLHHVDECSSAAKVCSQRKAN